MKTDTSLVAIKGAKHGLTITLLTGAMPDVLAELDERLTRTAAFLRGAQVTLNVENVNVQASDLSEIDALLQRHQITLRKIATTNEELAAAGVALGLTAASADAPSEPAPARAMPTRAAPATTPAADTDTTEAPSASAIVVRRTLRSGASVQHEGHVIIIGDVNPGAEVIAGGDVIVWGKLRGLVHAGALGDNNALVCALLLAPTQLRIGNTIARTPEEKKRRSAPEMASVREGKIEVVEWS